MRKLGAPPSWGQRPRVSSSRRLPNLPAIGFSPLQNPVRDVGSEAEEAAAPWATGQAPRRGGTRPCFTCPRPVGNPEAQSIVRENHLAHPRGRGGGIH